MVAMHEPIQNLRKVVAGCDPSLGIVFAGFFALIDLWPLLSRNSAQLWTAYVFLGRSCCAHQSKRYGAFCLHFVLS
jgi:hypothetical protein